MKVPRLVKLMVIAGDRETTAGRCLSALELAGMALLAVALSLFLAPILCWHFLRFCWRSLAPAR